MKFNFLLDIIKNPEIYKFLLVGIAGATTVLILTIVFTSGFGINYIISTAIAFEITVIWSFFVNDKWTFSQVKKTSTKFNRFIKYNLFYLISLGIIQIIMIFLTSQVGLHYAVSESIAIVIAFFFNFLVSKKISFKN